MIQVVELSDKELATLKSGSNTHYWSICLVMCMVALAFAAFFSEMGIGLAVCTLIVVIFSIAYFTTGKGPVTGKHKIIRQSKVKKARYIRVGYQVRFSTIEVELEEAEIPEPFVAIHTFTVYNSFGGVITYDQDDTLVSRYKVLEGQYIEIEYIADTGAVLAFRETPPFVLQR